MNIYFVNNNYPDISVVDVKSLSIFTRGRFEKNSFPNQEKWETKSLYIENKDSIIRMGKEVFSACGLYCGVCGIYLATQSNNTLLAEKLAQFYQVPPEAIRCHGCNSDTVFVFCKSCRIKECAASKHIAGCHECSSYPCDNIKQFPIPLGKKNIMRCVPFRRAFGTEVWEQEELRRYCCPRCQTPFFRGAKKCAHCKQEFVSE